VGATQETPHREKERFFAVNELPEYKNYFLF